MPNEIKNPKVLIETIKEVYNFMKAERLVEGFDRKTILRLIMEALSAEDIQTMANAKDNKSRRMLYKQFSKKYHPDHVRGAGGSPEEEKQANADFQDLTNLWKDPTLADEMLKKAQQGGGQQTKQDQGDQKEVSPKVKQTIQQLAKQFVDKYENLATELLVIFTVFEKDPAAFFQDTKQISRLLNIANALSEDIDPQMQKELGLEPGKTKENIQKLVAGLEKIRKQLLDALSRKSQAIQERPQKEEGEKEKEESGKQQQLSEKKGSARQRKKQGRLGKEKKIKPSKKTQLPQQQDKPPEQQPAQSPSPSPQQSAEPASPASSNKEKKQPKGPFLHSREWKDYAEKVLKKQFPDMDYNKTNEVLKQELETVGIGFGSGMLQEYLEYDNLSQKFIKAGAIPEAQVKLFTKQIIGFLNKMAKKHSWPPPGKEEEAEEEEKQEPKPMPLVPATIEKIEGNALTIQGKDGSNPITVTKEEAKASYDIITAADKFVRIYLILMQYLEEIAPEEVQKVITNKKMLQIGPGEPIIKPPVLMIGYTPEVKKPDPPLPPEDPKITDPEPDDGDGGMRYPRKALLEEYTNTLEFAFDEFEKSFLNVPMLKIQSGLYAGLEKSLISFKKAADNIGGAISKGEGDPTISAPSGKRDDLYEQLVSKVYNLITERTEVDFDEEGMSLFKTEYKQLLKLAKFLNQTVEKVDKNNLEKVGGDELVRQIRKIAEMLQESIGKVHDVVLNELRMDVEAGKKLTEEEGDETPPTDETPKDSGIQDPTPYDAHDTEGEAKRVQANKRSWEQKVKDVKNVYERVVNQLTLLNQLLESNEPRIEARKVNQLIQTSLKSLDSIRTFFPSQSPFGKRMPEGTSPEKYIKQMKKKVKQVVSDIVDIARQLKSTISNKPALQEEIQGVFKDLTDEQNVHKFAAQLKMASTMLQDYFDAPSKIGEVFANRSAKITNPEKAASMNDEGTQAIETGQAEEPKAEDADAEAKTQSLTKSSEVNTKLKTFAGKLESLQDTLSKLKTDLRVAEVIQTQDFPRVLAILLNKFPDPKEKVTEERGPKVTSTGTEPSYKLFDLTPQKIKYINSLIKLDNTGSLSMFFNALKKDTQGATALKRYLDKLLPEKKISFNMSYPEAVKLIKLGASKEEPEEQQNEELVRKLEPIIERYINNRKR